ncbi:hypothetical protein QL093DRAFT_2582675 [Fusarium oxysporum]|nr:hypothetical protein QL093DRAFT_2582675 [Fusarium oxysporum]
MRSYQHAALVGQETLHATGSNVPPPSWITNKASWKDVLESNEARALRTVAELRYRVSRKLESRGTASAAIGILPADSGSNSHQQRARHSPRTGHISLDLFHCDIFATPSIIQLTNGANIWQRQPDTICSTERNWMLNRLISKDDLFSSALSISACFEHSVTPAGYRERDWTFAKSEQATEPVDSILREEVERFSLMKPLPVEDFVWAGMLQGQWEVHHQAARKILNHIETAVPLGNRNSTSVIADVLLSLPEGDVRRRSLQLSIFNFIWIDVLATSTFGAVPYCPCAFDYLPLLDSGTIRPQAFMGCQSQIFAIVSRIARLEQLQLMHQGEMHQELTGPELQRQHSELEQQLDFVCQTLREDIEGLASVTSGLDLDAAMISLIWAYGARVLLQVAIAPIMSEQSSIDQTFVNICLEKL